MMDGPRYHPLKDRQGAAPSWPGPCLREGKAGEAGFPRCSCPQALPGPRPQLQLTPRPWGHDLVGSGGCQAGAQGRTGVGGAFEAPRGHRAGCPQRAVLPCLALSPRSADGFWAPHLSVSSRQPLCRSLAGLFCADTHGSPTGEVLLPPTGRPPAFPWVPSSFMAGTPLLDNCYGHSVSPQIYMAEP